MCFYNSFTVQKKIRKKKKKREIFLFIYRHTLYIFFVKRCGINYISKELTSNFRGVL